MSAFMVMNKSFGPTWGKMIPFLNHRKSKGNAWMPWMEDKSTLKLYETAHKAIYIFICKLCDTGFFKAGLNTKIRALDSENECDGDVGGSPSIHEMKQKIDRFLTELETTASKKESSHCSGCKCQAFDNTTTDQQRKKVDEGVKSLYDFAQRCMQKEIGQGRIFCAKYMPCC